MITMRRILLVSLLAPALLALAACDQGPVAPDSPTPSFARGGKKGGGDITQLAYRVETFDTAEARPYTDDDAVNAAVQAWIDDDGGYPSPIQVFGVNGEPWPSDVPTSDFFGCPDTSKPCHRIIATFSGTNWEGIGVSVSPSAQGCLGEGADPEGGCVYDGALGDSRLAAGWSQAGGKGIERAWLSPRSEAVVDHGDGTFDLIFYWQGQRVDSRYLSENDWGRVLSFYPDLERVGEADSFVFRFSFATSRRSGMFADLSRSCEDPYVCYASYKGLDPVANIWTVMDALTITTSGGKGKNKTVTASVGLDVQSFLVNPARLPGGPTALEYGNPTVLAESVDTWHTMMVTDPNSVRTIMRHNSTGRNPDDPDKPDIAKERFVMPLDAGPGCYELRLLMGYVHDRETGDDWTSLLRTVSKVSDAEGHVSALHYDGTSGTLVRGEACAAP